MTSDGSLAFYVPSLTVGGAERVTVTIANGLSDRGYDVDLLVSYYEGSFVDDVASGVTVFDLETPRVPALGVGASVPRLVSYFREQSPAMVFSQMTYASDVCLLAHWVAGSDAVTVPTIHNTIGIHERPKDRLVQWLAMLLNRRADQLVAVSEGAAESIVEQFRVERDRVTVLHNPIPVLEVRRRSEQPVRHRWLKDDTHDIVLGVGRLKPQKDFETFLRAFRHVHDQRPNTRALIIGRGPQRTALEATADDIGVADFVSFTGYVDNPYGYMAEADVLLMSSIHEGLPTVLIEALACGCPVVSTDCPSGPRTILQDGERGPLVSVGDDCALGDAALSTLENPPDPTGLMKRADDFAPSTVLDEYEAFVRTHISLQSAAEPISSS